MKSRRAKVKHDDLLTTAEAARLLGVTVATLEVWRNTGRRNVPFTGGGSGKQVWYRRADLLNLKPERRSSGGR